MTAILSATVLSPFDTTPGPPSCRLNEPFSFPGNATDYDRRSLNTVIHDQSRPSSPASVFSVMSAPQPRNNENVSPLSYPRKGQQQFRSLSSQHPTTCIMGLEKLLTKSRNFTYQPMTSNFEKQANEPITDDAKQTRAFDNALPKNSNAAFSLQAQLSATPLTPSSAPKHAREHLREISTSKVRPLNHSHNAMRTPETGLLSRIRELKHESTANEENSPDASLSSLQAFDRQQKLSDSSSGFVHSMKTASFTNASLSIFPRSSRIGRSTDSYMMHGSQPRHSVDSDRPLSSCSFEDAALGRGLKRHQIIDELILTEEAYVGDLKALVYLYSTLLASASSIPNRLRSAIEQNVAGILHSHETMLDRLHKARLQAAARRWADTVVPARLSHGRRVHLRNSERTNKRRPLTAHRHTKSDESTPHSRRVLPKISAEPADVYGIVIIFRESINGFFAYEEYCANFESIGEELQRYMPHLWTAYESGMESLARALTALDQCADNDRRALTVADLLIKPIQRLTKYPLILEQLLNNTPVADAPGIHADLDSVLQSVRDTLHMVNLARDSQYTRLQIQRRWLLQDRLDLSRLNITDEQFRSLGQVQLCGVLHVAYQTTSAINGGFFLCVTIDEHFLVAMPVGNTRKFEAIALIQISDIKVETSTDGKGLQCASTLFTWKISFACAGHYHELILSGCSKTEQDQWTASFRGEYSHQSHQFFGPENSAPTALALDLKSTGVVFPSQSSLSRESQVQRAATVGGRPSISQVIIRNTYNAQELQGQREPNTAVKTINRSQSHMTSRRVPILEPKRSERTRLENSISDIWTKERLPFPGMVGSRGGQIIRASAGTLARKLSLASIHTPFSKGRTSSLSITSRKSYDLFSDAKPTFEIRKKEAPIPPNNRLMPRDIPEVDDMRSVVGRMMGVSVLSSSNTPATDRLTIGRKRSSRNQKSVVKSIGTEGSLSTCDGELTGPASAQSSSFADEANSRLVKTDGSDASRRHKKRWSNPISKLREIGSEAKSMLYSSSYSGA